MPSLEQALRLKSRAAFTASLSEGKNARFLAINHVEVPCDPKLLTRSTPIKFTILRPVSAGFTTVPYKQGGGKQDPNAKKPSELTYISNDAGTLQPTMQMWSFKKTAKPTDKGIRNEELTWNLVAGNTVTLWLDEERLNKTTTDRAAGRATSRYYESVVPEGLQLIPAFTLCEISITPRSEEYAGVGSGLKVSSVKPSVFTLHSCLGDLQFLQSNIASARAKETLQKASNPAILKDLEARDVPFWAMVQKSAVIDDTDLAGTNSVRLSEWGDQMMPQIDIPVVSSM